MTSVTFSSRRGSALCLKVRMRRGWSRSSRQMRCTVVWDRPTRAERRRALQSVDPSVARRKVSATTSSVGPQRSH